MWVDGDFLDDVVENGGSLFRWCKRSACLRLWTYNSNGEADHRNL